MASISSISLSGIHAAQARLDTAAHNIANTETPKFHRQEVVQTEQQEGGVSTSLTHSAVEGSAVEADLVEQLQAKHAVALNVSVFKTSNQMAGTLLDTSA